MGAVGGDLLIDGHNRHAICQKHGLPFQTTQSQLFKDIEGVRLWMIEHPRRHCQGRPKRSSAKLLLVALSCCALQHRLSELELEKPT